MTEPATLPDAFEAHRTHLRSVAYRMLGSLSEADDAMYADKRAARRPVRHLRSVE